MSKQALKLLEIMKEILNPPRDSIRDRVGFKNLFSLFILSAEGGYTLDTNVMLNDASKRYAFPNYDRFKIPYRILGQNWVRIDIWMMYSPKHLVTEPLSMLEKYLSSWENIQNIIREEQPTLPEKIAATRAYHERLGAEAIHAIKTMLIENRAHHFGDKFRYVPYHSVTLIKFLPQDISDVLTLLEDSNKTVCFFAKDPLSRLRNHIKNNSTIENFQLENEEFYWLWRLLTVNNRNDLVNKLLPDWCYVLDDKEGASAILPSFPPIIKRYENTHAAIHRCVELVLDAINDYQQQLNTHHPQKPYQLEVKTLLSNLTANIKNNKTGRFSHIYCHAEILENMKTLDLLYEECRRIEHNMSVELIRSGLPQAIHHYRQQLITLSNSEIDSVISKADDLTKKINQLKDDFARVHIKRYITLLNTPHQPWFFSRYRTEVDDLAASSVQNNSVVGKGCI